MHTRVGGANNYVGVVVVAKVSENRKENTKIWIATCSVQVLETIFNLCQQA